MPGDLHLIQSQYNEVPPKTLLSVLYSWHLHLKSAAKDCSELNTAGTV